MKRIDELYYRGQRRVLSVWICFKIIATIAARSITVTVNFDHIGLALPSILMASDVIPDEARQIQMNSEALRSLMMDLRQVFELQENGW